MLSDNIRSYRKKANLSQDELAEKIGVSRQSVSFWETGQTQPSVDNIIALTKILNISSDVLLDIVSGSKDTSQDYLLENTETKKKRTSRLTVTICIVCVVIIGIAVLTVATKDRRSENSNSATAGESLPVNSKPEIEIIEDADDTINSFNLGSQEVTGSGSDPSSSAPAEVAFDLFTCCKDFAIGIGTLNGDYCIYQQPSAKYGGYEDEYFSISYWANSDMVEFCLHCPLSETQSHNFYLRMRGGYDQKYEYVSSKYYRDTGETLRSAFGFIDPYTFTNQYPISCDSYEGSADGQNEFMEESRIGICNLIYCLEEFVTVENMDCDFSDFGFINF